MRNTIKKVTIVVPVLMTSCHVSLKPKIGPLISHTQMVSAANANASGWPVVCAVHLAKRENRERGYGYMSSPFMARAAARHLEQASSDDAGATRRLARGDRVGWSPSHAASGCI